MPVTRNHITDRVEGVTEQAKDATRNIAEQAKEGAGRAAEQAKEGANRVADFAGQVADRTRDAARSAADKAGEVADTVTHRMNDAAGNVGSGLQSLASKVRETAPSGGMFSSVAEQAASGLDKTGDYLRHDGASALTRDLTNLARTHPIPAVLVGIACGYLLARATRA
jgi:predicted phage tail protein